MNKQVEKKMNVSISRNTAWLLHVLKQCLLCLELPISKCFVQASIIILSSSKSSSTPHIIQVYCLVIPPHCPGILSSSTPILSRYIIQFYPPHCPGKLSTSTHHIILVYCLVLPPTKYPGVSSFKYLEINILKFQNPGVLRTNIQK